MPEPLLEHVKRNSVHGGVDPEAVPQALGAALWRVRDAGLDHDPLDDLPDPHAADRPDRRAGLLAGLLRLSEAVGGVERVEIVRRDGDGPEVNLLAPRGVLALLQAADGDGAAGQVHACQGDLEKLRGAAPGEVQRLAERAVAGGLSSRRGQEGRALLGVQVEPVAGGVMEAHFTHGEHYTRIVLSGEALPGLLPDPSTGSGCGALNTIANSVAYGSGPQRSLARRQSLRRSPPPNAPCRQRAAQHSGSKYAG